MLLVVFKLQLTPVQHFNAEQALCHSLFSCPFERAVPIADASCRRQMAIHSGYIVVALVRVGQTLPGSIKC